ncbi:MAG: CheB methylesterase domain-containing protein [Myxococcales bacterium]
MSQLRVIVVERFPEDLRRTCAFLAAEPRLAVVPCEAHDTADILDRVTRGRADVVVLAVSLLRQGSQRFPVKALVADCRARVVLMADPIELTTPTSQQASAVALLEGALDVAQRPGPGLAFLKGPSPLRDVLVSLLERAERAPIPPAPGGPPAGAADRHGNIEAHCPEIVGVASSAGGPGVLIRLFRGPLRVPVLIAQHTSLGFAFALHDVLHRVAGDRIRLAEDGCVAEPGRVYLSPDGRNLGISPGGRLRLTAPAPALPHPNADVLFSDLAAFGSRAAALVLTGMGRDGLLGAERLRRAGGSLLVQSRESCLVFGMPGAVVEAGLAQAEWPPEKLSEWLQSCGSPPLPR